MATLTDAQEQRAAELVDALGMDLPSAREAVAIADGLTPGCLTEG